MASVADHFRIRVADSLPTLANVTQTTALSGRQLIANRAAYMLLAMHLAIQYKIMAQLLCLAQFWAALGLLKASCTRRTASKLLLSTVGPASLAAASQKGT